MCTAVALYCLSVAWMRMPRFRLHYKVPLLDKLINSGVPDLSSHGNNNQTHLN